MLRKRENATMIRIENTQKATEILRGFIGLGFKSMPAILAIVQHHRPEITRDELLAFWHFRNVNTDFVSKMDSVFEKLKQE